MANAKGRLKSHRRGRKKRGRPRTKALPVSRVASQPVEDGPPQEKRVEAVMRRSSDNTELLSTAEKVHMLFQNGHLLKDKFLLKSSPKIKKPFNKKQIDQVKSLSTVRERLITKSGRIVKKNKEDLRLIDNILKSELMINNGLNKKNSNDKATGSNNNNDVEITDQNDAEPEQTKSKKSTAKAKDKTYKIRPAVKKKHPEPKQVTLTNGVVLTVSEYECDTCRKTFSNKSSLRRHMYIHLGIKPYTCPFCKKLFYHYLNMQKHVARDHKELALPSESYLCHICDKVFKNTEDLGLHLSCHINNDAVYKCIFCNEQFSHQILLTRHEKLHLASGRYCCTLCPMTYLCRERLTKHVRSHLNIKEHICQFCGKDFLRMNSMKRHVNISHDGQRIQCPICKKNLKGHLTEHMRTHEKRRPHACPECGQCFTQSTQLNVHRRSVHTGDRPYHCRICDSRFSHSNALMLHVRRHTGEKPFPCAVCPLAFSQLPHMKAHMRKIHKKDNPYKCNKCNQFFKLKADIESHAKSCKVGERELSFEEKIEASVRMDEEIEVESVMSLSRMRFLLALLFTMITSNDKLKYLGFNKRLIDDVLIESLEAMDLTPCKDQTLSPQRRLRFNIDLMMKNTIPKEQIEKFEKENKTTEEILELLTDDKKSE